MSFEDAILSKVAATVGDEVEASFCYGTLFVQCNEVQAQQVLERLKKDTFGKVLMSKGKCSPEYAFDFTA